VNDDLSISNLCESKVGDIYLYFAVGLMLSLEPVPKTTGFSLVKGMLFLTLACFYFQLLNQAPSINHAHLYGFIRLSTFMFYS